ncbi:MAG: alkaline phosphatase family protein [Planctomycetes bacterium]|nr:alkaline phosphatase family protein [Planctomycetota bacterium]
MALVQEFSGAADIPNLTNALNDANPSKLTYRGTEHEFSWAYTAQSPPKYYTYAAGTTVFHVVRNPDFKKYKPLSKSDVVVQRKEGGQWKDDPNVTVDQVTHLFEGVAPDGTFLDEAFKLKLILKSNSRLFDEKRVKFTVYENNVLRDKPIYWGRFEVDARLKIVIFMVDGLGHTNAINLLNDTTAPIPQNFQEIFGDAVNRGSAALSALATVTWSNWPGILSGMAPKDHGIVGNAFFERERAPDIDPFDSSGSLNRRTYGRAAKNGLLKDRAKDDAAADQYLQAVKDGLPQGFPCHRPVGILKPGLLLGVKYRLGNKVVSAGLSLAVGKPRLSIDATAQVYGPSNAQVGGLP